MSVATPDQATESDLDISHLDPFAKPDEDNGDAGEHDRFAHYVNKEDIVLSTTQGVPVYAVCGKKWVAKRNPDKYPVCPTCKEIYGQMQPGDGEA